MKVIHIISGVLLLISCMIIILIVLFEHSKDQGMTSAITGGSNDSFYGRSGGSRTKEAKLNKITKISAIVFFVLTLTVNILAVYVKK